MGHLLLSHESDCLHYSKTVIFVVTKFGQNAYDIYYLIFLITAEAFQ